jgi:hypothetical protein
VVPPRSEIYPLRGAVEGQEEVTEAAGEEEDHGEAAQALRLFDQWRSVPHHH